MVLRTAKRDSGESIEEMKDKTVEKRGWGMAQRLRALAALEEHPDSVLSSRGGGSSQLSLTRVSEDSVVSRQAWMHIHMQAKHLHIQK